MLVVRGWTANHNRILSLRYPPVPVCLVVISTVGSGEVLFETSPYERIYGAAGSFRNRFVSFRLHSFSIWAACRWHMVKTKLSAFLLILRFDHESHLPPRATISLSVSLLRLSLRMAWLPLLRLCLRSHCHMLQGEELVPIRTADELLTCSQATAMADRTGF